MPYPTLSTLPDCSVSPRQALPDLVRSLLQMIIDALLSADADAVCGAEWGKLSPGRVAQRSGHRHRALDTRVRTVDVVGPTRTSTNSATAPFGEAGPFTFIADDALTMKVCEGGRVMNAVVMVATGWTPTAATSEPTSA